MFGKEKEREDYWNFSKDLYTHNIFSDKTIGSIQDDYIWNKENYKNKDKEKDDYEIEMWYEPRFLDKIETRFLYV